MTTTTTFISRVRGAITHALQVVFPSFKENSDVTKTVEGAIAVGVGSELRLLEKLGEQATREACPITASSNKKNDMGQLENWGFAILGRQPYAATAGKYKITLTGTGTVNSGKIFINTDTNLVYLLTETVTAPTSNAVVQSSGFGTEVALEVGDVLTMDSQVAGVDAEAAVNTITQTPADGETDEEYQDAIKTALRNKPRGGARGDYRDWCVDIAGLYKVYPYTGPALGSMVVYVQAIKTDANKDGAPDSALLEDVEDVLLAEQPATAGSLSVYAMVRLPAVINISGLTDNEKQQDVLDAVDSYIYALEPFIAGVDLELERNDRVTKGGLMAAILDAIRPATITELDIYVNGVKWSNTELPQGSVMYVSEVNFD